MSNEHSVNDKFSKVLKEKLNNGEISFPEGTLFEYEPIEAYRLVFRDNADFSPLNSSDMKSYAELNRKPRGVERQENDPRFYGVSLSTRIDRIIQLFNLPKPTKKIVKGLVCKEGGPQLTEGEHVCWWLYENASFEGFEYVRLNNDIQLCFIINNEKIYLESKLIEFNEIPVFYICKSIYRYYIVLCLDIDQLEYILIESSIYDILDMLNEKITMRELYGKVSKFFDIKCGDTPSEDDVSEFNISQLDLSVLPLEGAKYHIYDEAVRQYRDELILLCSYKELINDLLARYKKYFETDSRNEDKEISSSNFRTTTCSKKTKITFNQLNYNNIANSNNYYAA